MQADHARAAAGLVDVTYDVLAPNTDPVAALAPDAPLSVWGTESNVLSTSSYRRGADFDEAFAASAFTVSGPNEGGQSRNTKR